MIASTATTIGVGLGPQGTGGLDATLGYKRAEFALVPTNRPGTATGVVTGAEDSADVIMELRYSGIFSTGTESGIYQRLAIGREAVKQQGAAYMFAKGHDGKIDENVLKAVSTIPVVGEGPSSSLLLLSAKREELKRAKQDAAVQKFDKAAVAAGYANFNKFYFDARGAAKEPDIAKVRKALEADGVTFN